MTNPTNAKRYVRITKEEYDELIEENICLKECVIILEDNLRQRLELTLSEIKDTKFKEQISQIKSLLNE